VELIYLALPSTEMSRLRVAERVAHGGHNIPEYDIIRRFTRSLYNFFQLFAPLVNQTRCFMNSGDFAKLVFQKNGNHLEVFNPDLFKLLQQEARL
jgi:predicted ABC-type ATPase